MICDLCERFQGKRHHVEWEADGVYGFTLSKMNTECKEWLEKMFDIRSRFIREYRKQ